MAIADAHKDKLKELKEWVKNWFMYYNENNVRFRGTRQFVYQSNISQQERAKLQVINKPAVESNTLAVYLSRWKGAFVSQSPSFKVSCSDDNPHPNQTEISFYEGHLQSIKKEADKYGFSIQVYDDQISGGYSVAQLGYDYTSPYSNNQRMYFEKKWDATLCGFDPLSKLPHKGDGRYAFELVPILSNDLKNKYPHLDISGISFSRDDSTISFSYTDLNQEKIALLCYMYVKKRKKIKINRLSTGQDVTDKQYENLKKYWESSHKIEQLPVVSYSRMSKEEIICRYVFCETEVLEYEETPFSGFPLVFIDGDSTIIHNSATSGRVTQFTRPAIWSALDCQRVKNLALQTLANEVENMVQHKFMAAAASVPERYIEAWINPQKPSTLIYNHVDEFNNPLPEPRNVQRPPIPPEVMQLYETMDQSIQTCLGSFDPMYAEMSRQNISGRAIVETATQNNSSAMPYITNFMIGLNRLAQLVIDLCPKIYVTPQLVPIIDLSGKRILQPINIHDDHKSISLSNKPNDIKVEVVAGVNFEIQKNQALQTLEGLSEAFPVVQQFINQMGLGVIMDNVSIKGSAVLQDLATKFQEKMQQDMQSQKNQPPPPEILKLHQQAEKNQMDNQIDQKNIEIKQQELELKTAELQNKAKETNNKHVATILGSLLDKKSQEIEEQRVHNESVRNIADIAGSHIERQMTGAKHILEHHAKMTQVLQPPKPLSEDIENET